MNIIAKRLSVEEFKEYLKTFNFGSIAPTKLVIHHTAVPTKEDWRGEKTLMGIKNYYENLKWPSGPHLFVAEDGIWLFTPMNEVGTHAGAGNGSWLIRVRPQWYSLGIEVVGNYDKVVWDGKTRTNALHVIKSLMERLTLTSEDVTFHRDWMPKSCPGNAITREWLFQQLEIFDQRDSGEPSPWAAVAWEWQRELGLDLSVHPHQKVEAEWVFAILKKIEDIHSKK